MMVDDLKKGIEVSKNLLETLPKNNIKNIQKYKDKLLEIKNNYDILLDKVLKDINNRKNRYNEYREDSLMSEKFNKIKSIKEKLYLLNKYNTAYEKFGFDKILYELDHFYKDNLDNANSNIFDCIKLFNDAGIKLSIKDFDYSQYVNKYMMILLNDDGNNIKECFEEIYWQCPDLFKQITLNIKSLYYKNQSLFEKYASSLKDEFIREYSGDIITLYKEMVTNYDNLVSSSLYIGLNKFLNNELNINDFQEIKVKKYYERFVDDINENYDELSVEVNKYALSSLEYKNYLYFKYIIDDLKKAYSEKEKYKNLLKPKMKLIQKKEKVLSKYNSKKKKARINVKISNLIIELDNLYKEFDNDVFYDKVYKCLNDNSSIYDALCVACSYYTYIVKCIKSSDKSVSFDYEYNKLIDFLLDPYNTIIGNIAITEDRNIPLIISDRYKLSNFKVSKEELENDSTIDEIISLANKIDIYNKIVLKITYDNIYFLVETKDIEKN